MSDDLVKRLRARVAGVYDFGGEPREYPDPDCHEAADRIEALEAQAYKDQMAFDALAGAEERCEDADRRIEVLEAALRPFTFPLAQWGGGVSCMELPVAPEWIDAARRALDGTSMNRKGGAP